MILQLVLHLILDLGRIRTGAPLETDVVDLSGSR
jgi:hypothetical protein